MPLALRAPGRAIRSHFLRFPENYESIPAQNGAVIVYSFLSGYFYAFCQGTYFLRGDAAFFLICRYIYNGFRK